MTKFLISFLIIALNIPAGAQIKPRWDTILFSGGNAPELLVLDTTYVSMVQSNTNWNALQIWETNFQGKLIDTQEVVFSAHIENCGNCLERISPNRFMYAHTLFYRTDSLNVQLVKFNRNLVYSKNV